MISRLNRHLGYKLMLAVALGVVLGMLLIVLFHNRQQSELMRTEYQHSMTRLTETVVQGVQSIMLGGYADIAGSYADNLKNVPEIVDFRIIRRDGLEAFRDNRTIHEVNRRIGDEEFIPRDDEQVSENRILEADQAELVQAIESLAPVPYYENQDSGERLLTFVSPIRNLEPCHACHGADHEVRGLVKLTTSLTASEAAITRSLYGSMGAVAAATLVLLAVLGFLIRRMSLPILQVALELQRFAKGDGDLTVKLPVRGNDEIAQLAEGFNEFLGKIRQIIRKVAESGRHLATLSQEVAEITERTSADVVRQEAKTGTVMVSTKEMAATIHEISASAAHAAEVADHVDRDAARGRAQVAETVKSIGTLVAKTDFAGQAMAHLDEEMANIDTILATIRAVAEQTNLLALNASIEAARAGDQGRGFAVVAVEVRSLASRTQKSAAEIREVIERLSTSAESVVLAMSVSREQANASMAQAEKSGDSLQGIAEAAATMDRINHDIAKAVEGESDVIEGITSSVGEISEVAARTAEGARDTASRASELARMADELQTLIGRFRF